MYVTTSEGSGGLFWWQIKEKTASGKERTIAINSAPGFQTEAEAREEGERLLMRPHGFAYHFWPLLFAVVALCTSAYVIADWTVGLN